ncbi:Crp/Fnr family transcriptional regulator [Palleronia caenipelagi]|nr:Crp/Fnr family transcriptional regulator [Palleronia caenipelagi]
MSAWIHLFDGAPTREFPKGTALFRAADPVRSMYLLRSGMIALERPMADGTSLTLHLASAGSAVAEASLFADRYHCDAVARVDSEVAVLPKPVFLRDLERQPRAALSLIETHAREVQAQRARVEVLRMRRVADRLDAWITLHGEPAQGDWSTVAHQIGVSPAALYRERAKRR